MFITKTELSILCLGVVGVFVMASIVTTNQSEMIDEQHEKIMELYDENDELKKEIKELQKNEIDTTGSLIETIDITE